MAYWPTSWRSTRRVCSAVSSGAESSQPGRPASPRQNAHGQSQRRVTASYVVSVAVAPVDLEASRRRGRRGSWPGRWLRRRRPRGRRRRSAARRSRLDCRPRGPVPGQRGFGPGPIRVSARSSGGFESPSGRPTRAPLVRAAGQSTSMTDPLRLTDAHALPADQVALRLDSRPRGRAGVRRGHADEPRPAARTPSRPTRARPVWRMVVDSATEPFVILLVVAEILPSRSARSATACWSSSPSCRSWVPTSSPSTAATGRSRRCASASAPTRAVFGATRP